MEIKFIIELVLFFLGISFAMIGCSNFAYNWVFVPRKARTYALVGMIFIDSDKRELLLEKMRQYIAAGVKGQKIAFMIVALRKLGYLLPTTSNRQLFEAIRGYFMADIGSDKGIYAYLNNKVYTQFESDIETLKNNFNVD